MDAGQIKLHLRARTGLRIEETAALCDHVEAPIRQVIPAEEVQSIVDNIGLALQRHQPLLQHLGARRPERCRHLRRAQRRITIPATATCASCAAVLADRFPSTTLRVPAGRHRHPDLNFGLPSPIDVQISGINTDANREVANNLLQKMRRHSRGRGSARAAGL